ncbi:MAG: hypothetical protein ACRDDH_11780 [Cetobacterium sp.]|uniref:hypothetical protein n=1 Tax=Cetobacterium sp. TaxID=2071632 RepID=UPI003EE63EA7
MRFNKKMGLAMILGALLLTTGCAKKEIVDIKPNENAYIINNFAESKDDTTQKFDGTREDWSKIKSSSKMVRVEFDRVSTGAVSYRRIPQKKVIVVSQGIVSKDWVASLDKGSNRKDDSLKAESQNGAEFHTGITLSAKISDTDTYLSIYGIDPKSDINDVKVEAFTLDNVLEKTIKPYIQGELNAEFSKYPTFEIQPKKNEVVKIVEARTKERFAQDGIQILTFNPSDTVKWEDPKIQQAINEKAQLEALREKAAVQQQVEEKQAETRRKVQEQEAMAKSRAVELQAESGRKAAEIERLKQDEINKQALAKAKNEVDIAKEKAKVVSVEREMLTIEKERASIRILEINAAAELERAKKWNGKMPLAEVTVQGASSMVDTKGNVQGMIIGK